MRIPYYHIDAFASRPFAGNPAGVCLLERFPAAEVMQRIAAENNLSETAFLVGGDGQYQLRWFTPTMEVDLCGHATLASAFVVFQYAEPGRSEVRFQTASGLLTVTATGDRLSMDFPARAGVPGDAPPDLVAGLGHRPRETHKARDYLAVFETEAQVRALRPDLAALRRLDCLGVIATAPGDAVDFVSRFFAPQAGIDEDPVTGSAHCTLVPYWSRRLGRHRLHAWQVSSRGGELWCDDLGERVAIAGHAVSYLEGTVIVPEA